MDDQTNNDINNKVNLNYSNSSNSSSIDDVYISPEEMELLTKNVVVGESENETIAIIQTNSSTHEQSPNANKQTNSSSHEQSSNTNQKNDEASKAENNTNKIFKKYLYNSENDVGPFRIIIERKNKPINKITAGYLLKKLKLNSGLMDMKKNGIKKVIAYFKTAVEANAILNYNTCQLEYNFFLPVHFISVRGVISGIPEDITLEEIIEEIDTNTEILHTYRINRFKDGKKVPTDKVSIAFRTNQLPRYVRLCNIRSRVDPFISKSAFCTKCLRFNHMEKNCRSNKIRCNKCSAYDCSGEKCENYCFFCKENHKPNSKLCKETTKQKKIKTIMATAALSYQEVNDELDYFLKNKYDVLSDLEEEPKIYQTYAEFTNSHQKSNPWKKAIKTPQKAATATVQVINNKRKREDDDKEERGVALNNPHKTMGQQSETVINNIHSEDEIKYQNILYTIYTKLINKQNLNQILQEIENNFKFELIDKQISNCKQI